MLRSELEDILSIVSPALSSKEFVPLFKNVFFTAEHVETFNGHLYIRHGSELKLIGATPGKTLVDVVSVSNAKDVTFSEAGDVFLVALDKTKIKLPRSQSDALPSILPKNEQPRFTCTVDGVWLKALNTAVVNASDDTTLGDMMGTVFLIDERYATFYTTDNNTISRSRIVLPRRKKNDPPVTPFCCGIPNDFIKELIRIKGKVEPDSPITVRFFDKVIWADFDGQVEVVSSLFPVADTTPEKMRRAVDAHAIDSRLEDFVPIPEALSGSLDRALVFFENDASRYQTIVNVNEAVCEVSTATGKGESKDVVPLASSVQAVAVKIDPRLLRRGLGVGEYIKFSKSAIVLTDSNDPKQQTFVHLIGVQSPT